MDAPARNRIAQTFVRELRDWYPDLSLRDVRDAVDRYDDGEEPRLSNVVDVLVFGELERTGYKPARQRGG